MKTKLSMSGASALRWMNGLLKTAFAPRLLPLLLLVLTSSATVQASDYTYMTAGGQITITGYFGSSSAVTIPSTIDGLPVTAIGENAFYGLISLASVTIPNGLTSIGGRAFYGCSSLASVTIPNSVTTIGGGAFWYCTSLVSVTIPSSVISIEDYTFSGCTRLVSVTIPSSVTSIGDAAFYGCSSLASATIPSSVTTIGNSAFWYCTRLASLTIPSSVTTIGYDAFEGCTSLTSVTIPSSVISIEDYTFSGCASLVSLTIPSSVTTFGNYAFSSCTSLASVTIPSSVTSIGNSVFYGCTSLKSVTIPSSVTYIESEAFRGCTSLMSVTIPNTVTGIGESAFSGCSSLASATIPSGVTAIGGYAFSGCTRLASVTIPSSVTYIESGPFSDCTRLVAINVETDNSTYKSVDGVLFNKSQTTLIQCPGGKTGNYTIPNSVTTIGEFAFSGCSSLASVTIPNTVTTIGEYTFEDCTSLVAITVDAKNLIYRSVDGVLFNKSQTTLIQCPGGKTGDYTIPNSVTTIGGYAFSGCTSLMSVTIPSSLTGIGDQAFFGCTRLAAITVEADNSDYGSVDGVLFDKSQTTLIRCPGGRTGDYMIPGSVTKIGFSAFYGCTSLATVTIPSSVTSIGAYAFGGCTSLARVYFEGDRPILLSSDVFPDSEAVIVYYRAGTVGWGAEFAGQPTALWIPPPSYGAWVQTTALLTQYPQASAETDDPDQDGMSNYEEMLAGTDPTDRNSLLILERLPRPADLTTEDKSPIQETQHALYIRSVPGKNYGVQSAARVGGPWRTSAVVTATTTQKRLIFNKPAPSGGAAFYRVILAQ